MAVARVKLGGLLCAIALCMSAGRLAVAQTALAQQDSSGPSTGVLTGKLTDLRSVPLAGVTIVVRNRATGAEARTKTGKNGFYRFAALDAGEYTIEAESDQLGHGELEGVEIAAGHEARVQAAMQLEPRLEPPFEHRPAMATNVPSAPSSVVAAELPPKPPVQALQQPQAPLDPARFAPRVAPPVAPPTASAALDAVVADEPLQSAPVSGQPIVAAPARPTLQTTTPVINARVDAAPLQQFLLAAVRAGVPGGAVLHSVNVAAFTAPMLAMSMGAARGVQAAIEVSELTAVAAAAKQTGPVTPAVTTELSGEELQALPASGRNWQDFVLETPTSSAAAGSSQASLRGAGQDPADTTIDGESTRLAFGGAAGSEPGSQDTGSTEQVGPGESGAREGWPSGRGVALSETAIQQVQTEAGNVETAGMHAAGGRMNVDTERGSNELHGQGFFFDRQNNWGAQNPFTQWVTETAPATLTYNPSGPPLSVPVFDNGPTGLPQSYTPPDHETIGGLGMGDRIRRDKLFWFAALDSYHRNDPGLSMVKHPYLEETPSGCGTTSGCTPTTTGFFATPSNCQLQLLGAQLGLTAPSSSSDCVNGLVQGLTAYSQMLGTLTGLLGPAPRTAAQWTGFVRIDWQAAERHRFTLEGIGADWNSPGGGLTGTAAYYGNHSFGSSQASQQWLLARWEAYLSPNLLAVTQGSAGRTILTARPDTPSAFEQSFLSGSAYGQLPQIVVDSSDGFTIGNPSRFGQGSYPDEKLYHGQEMLNWVHNRLLVKAGVEIGHNADATSLLRNQTGTFSYSKVQNFISDALAFQTFGLNPSNYQNPHNCGVTASTLGALPCYSYYSQTLGPTNWSLSTNDWAGFATAQWQPAKRVVLSAGMRWELEQLPPPLAALNNTALPLTEQLPALGSEWGPRIGVAFGSGKGRWPVVRLGYGMYFGRTENATVESALTQTGSLQGDLSIFERPTDGYNSRYGTSAAPLFPNVLTGDPGSVVTPGAVEFAPNFHNPEIHQGLAAIEETLPGHVMVTAATMVSLGRRLPVLIDSNLGSLTATQTITYTVCDEAPSGTGNGACGNLGLGPIKASTITVPFYASWPSTDCPSSSQNLGGQCGWSNPNYQEIDQTTSKANSTYEAAMVKVTRYGSRGLSLHAHYTYSHAMDWNPGASPIDPNPADFRQEYGTSNLDVRHSAAAMVVYEAPWKLRDVAGRIANGWMLSGIGQFRSGLPYTMRVSGSLAEEFDQTSGAEIAGLRTGMNGSGGDNRVYGLGSDGQVYNIGRNTYRYPDTWKADLRLGKKFGLGEMGQLEVLAESFNLFNHQNVTEIETTGYIIEPGNSGSPPTLNFLTGLKISTTTGLPIPGFGQPLNINATDFYRERQFQFGVRFRF